MAAVSRTHNLKTTTQQRTYPNPTRRPLIPSVESPNGNVASVRRPRPRDVASRYLSTSSSSSSSSNSASSASTLSNSSCLPSLRRCPSPIVSRSTIPETAAAGPTPVARGLVTRRAQSVERRRVPTSRPNVAIGAELSTSAAKQLLTSSKRSLSVSFQGESYSMPFNKTKPAVASTPNLRKPTPERKRTSTPILARTQPRRETNHRENAKPSSLDQQQLHHPWPGRSRQVNSSSSYSVQPLSRSVDLTAERKKLMSGSGRVVRALQKSLTEGFTRSSSSGELKQTQRSNNDRLNAAARDVIPSTSARSFSRLVSSSDSMVSDTESVCSDSNSGPKNGGATRGIVIPARYLQDRHPGGSPLTRSSSMGRTVASSKLSVPKKLMCNSPSSSSSPKGAVLSRGMSPLRGGVRPASPSRGGVRPASPSGRLSTPISLDRPSSSRGMASPSRIRNSTGSGGVCVNSNVSSTPSVLSFAADIRRVAKVGDNRISDSHLLRLLHNRQLQWRFINARAEDVLSVQKYNAEMILFSTWKTTSDLCSIVLNKRLELSRLRLKLKLTSILNHQMPYLEDWALMDEDHSNSLVGAIESLEASTLRLPVVCGARADIQSLKDAICSAVDVLHAMAYSICSLFSNVEDVNRLVTEVASLSSSEHALLNECKDILSSLAAMQVKDCSLRTHVLQLEREPSMFAVEA